MLKGEVKIELKKSAIFLRKKGYSYPMIEKELGVVRATLSGWFKGIKLSKVAERMIGKRKIINLIEQRQKALKVLKEMREMELEKVRLGVEKTVSTISFESATKEALLAMLYLGEGFKRKSTLGFGNSNANILIAFIKLLREVYDIEEKRITCSLHLRYDQDSEKEKVYWSKLLGIGEDRFRKPQFDKRTIGSKTWEHYHGVCSIYCHDARLEKRLSAFQVLLLKKIIGAASSVG